MKTLFKKLFGKKSKEKTLAEKEAEAFGQYDGLDENFLFDFKNYQSQYSGTGSGINTFLTLGGSALDSGSVIDENQRKLQSNQ